MTTRTIHSSFAPKGFDVVVHTDDACPFIVEADDRLRPDQTTLPDDVVVNCRFCAGERFVPERGHVGHEIAEDATPSRPTGNGEGSRHPEVNGFGATAKQLGFITRLLADRDHTTNLTPGETKRLERWTAELADGSIGSKTASTMIDWLLQRPYAATVSAEFTWSKKDGQWFVRTRTNGHAQGDRIVIHKADGSTVDAVLDAMHSSKDGWQWWNAHRYEEPQTDTNGAQLPEVPEGHYAIESTGDNDLAFYRVDRPTEGQYAGRVFVKLIVGGHPDQNVKYAAIPGILARIAAAGIEEAGARYGQEIGRCWRCNRTLTDEESRRLGIGPTCRSL